MFMLVFAAVGVFGAGMLAIAAGIPIKDFGYGNTLILSGVMAWCTSALMLSLWACFRELKKNQPDTAKIAAPESVVSEARPAQAPAAPLPTMPPGWPEAIPERAPAAPSSPVAPPPPAAPPPALTREARRNLLFTSTRRPKDAGPRDATAPAEAGMPPPPSPPEMRPAAPDEERPALARRLDPPPRVLRPSTTLAPREPVAPPPPAPPPPLPPALGGPDDAPAATATAPVSAPPLRETDRPARSEAGNVSVLKSGVVDGMAYWLYSDGSIEAQMPEGMMRFTSIDELRAHLDKRP